MQASIETLGSLERRLNIAVPLQEIDAEVDSRLKRLARTVKMHGFRPGKVPFKVVAQHYGGQIRQEVLGDTLQKSFGDAVRAQNLRVAGYPKFEAKPASESTQQFEYSATFEVYPEVALGSLSDRAIVRPALKVGDAEVDKTIEILRVQRTVYAPVERGAGKGDRVTMSYTGTIEGVEFAGGKAENQAVIVGGGQLLQQFDDALPGMKSGDSKQFELTFPSDYHGKEVAGKTASFEVRVTAVEEPRLPDIDADFARGLGVADGNIATMRDEVKANVEREVARRVKARVKEQVMQALLDTTRLELPKSLVQIEVQRMAQAMRRELQQRGAAVDTLPFAPETFEAPAQRRVSLGLILAELVKSKGLHAKPEQVRTLIDEQAQSYERPDEVVKWYYQSPERLAEIESLVLEDNVVNWVLSVAKVEDQSIAFDELMDKGQAK